MERRERFHPLWERRGVREQQDRGPRSAHAVLDLLQISLVYVNTLMIQQVLAQPAWQGRLTATDLRALTPLKWQHINPYGTFMLDMRQRLRLELAA